MAILDLILNLVGLLLWLGWRAVGFDQAARPAALSLASTLRRAEPAPQRSYTPLVALAVLLVGRSIVYWQLGSVAEHTPTLDLGLVSLSVRADLWSRMLLFSCLSFAQALGVLYLVLLLALLATRGPGPRQPTQVLVELQFGPLAHWPGAVLLPAVPLLSTLLWLLLYPPMLWLGLVSAPPPGVHLWQQGLSLGLGAFLVWKWPAVAAFGLYAVNSYVYVGALNWWNYVVLAGQTLLRPFRWPVIRNLVTFGKVDLAPAIAIALTLTGGYYLEILLRRLFSLPMG